MAMHRMRLKAETLGDGNNDNRTVTITAIELISCGLRFQHSLATRIFDDQYGGTAFECPRISSALQNIQEHFPTRNSRINLGTRRSEVR